MEINYVKKILLVFFLTLISCSNSKEIETTEIKIAYTLRDALFNPNKYKQTFDVRKIISRETVQKAGVPMLFVELESGQNGALAKYPSKGYGITWLGADGATLTLEKGIIIASRGMGNDVMGGHTNIPSWKEILNEANYTRNMSHLIQDNKIQVMNFDCKIKKDNKKKPIKILDVKFVTSLFIEICKRPNLTIKNLFYVDKKNMVRRSIQYHSEKIGYILTERLDLQT